MDSALGCSRKHWLRARVVVVAAATPYKGAVGGALTVAGQWSSLARVEGRLAAPQILLALRHQERVAHVAVVKVLKQQSL